MRLSVPIFAAIFALGSGAAVAAAAAAESSRLDDPALPGQTRYDRCLALAQKKPQQAFDSALVWRDQGGGGAAAHCIAVALVGLRHYAEAALKLDALARDPAIGDAGNRAAILGQAGNAWLLAGKPEAALLSLSAALKLTPGDPDMLADRARAKAMRKDWTGADADLTAALARNPERPDLLVLRASARRALGRNAQARADIDSALRLRPGFDEALVERGAMKFDAGDKAGARADWQKVLVEAPKGAAANFARKHIEQLGSNAPVRAQ